MLEGSVHATRERCNKEFYPAVSTEGHNDWPVPSDWIWSPFYKIELMPVELSGSQKMWIYQPWTLQRNMLSGLNWLLMIHCYTHRLVHLSTLITDTSFCGRWLFIQRTRIHQYAENNSGVLNSKYNTCIISLSARFNDHLGKRGGKIVYKNKESGCL